MKRTPRGTPVGVDDPLSIVDRCDWVTQDGRCRLAIERPDAVPRLTSERRADDYRCPHVAERDWADCPGFASRDGGRRCVRCGLEARPLAHDAEARALLEEHHVSYPEIDGIEITVTLCRWCHAKVHAGDARVDDAAEPDPAAREEVARRRAIEREESFSTAADRRD